MKKILLLFFVILLSNVVSAQVLITEVLYDPIGSETGGEAVQIYNQGTASVDISGFVIVTESSANDATIPQGTIIGPYAHYLVADAGWASLKDNASWPSANHEEALTLSNTDAGIALMNGSMTIDAVGWGISANINSGLYEGNGANATLPGKSLKRKFDLTYVDTNNNLADFYTSTPLFAQVKNANSLQIYAVIEGRAPTIQSVTFQDEDSFEPGIQIIPVPKTHKSVLLSVTVADSDAEDIDEAWAVFNSQTYSLNKTFSNGTIAMFTRQIEFPYYLAPANYTIEITVLDFANMNATSTISFEYLSIVGLELDQSTLVLNALPGKTLQLHGDADLSTANLTIRNTGNSKLDFKISGTDLVSPQGVIPVNSLAFSFDGSNASVLSYNDQLKKVSLSPGEQALKGLSFTFSVPTTTMPGNYSGSIYLTAVSS